MSIKRLILVVLTAILVLFYIAPALVQSWSQPQIQSRLELYQTNLLLHAQEWQEMAQAESSELAEASQALIGEDVVQTAQQQYQQARQTAQQTQSKIVAKLQELSPSVATSPELPDSQLQVRPLVDTPSSSQQRQQLKQSLSQVKQLIVELNLRLGLLYAQQGELDTAIKTWMQLIEQQAEPPVSESQAAVAKTADVLVGLWSDPPRLLPDAELLVQNNLDSWFRYRALSQLYQLQQRQEALSFLQQQEQEIAQQAVVKLGLLVSLQGLAGLLGVGLLLFALGQRVIRDRESLLATNSDRPWHTPWGGDITWQAMLGFFLVGQVLISQLLVPLSFALWGVNPTDFSVELKALFVLINYLLMATGSLLVLYLSIQAFLPLSEEWFCFRWRNNWIVWGVGGYLTALPLVVIVSIFNQQLWQGQGGSNPLLPLVLEGRNSIAVVIFFITASLAAPAFEEVIFRGFFLPSLTPYVPVWGAITLSSLLFAVAHLNLSEVLPLFTLGIVLGVVYTRSRNLLAPILLHSLWNGGTLLSLIVLGSGAS